MQQSVSEIHSMKKSKFKVHTFFFAAAGVMNYFFSATQHLNYPMQMKHPHAKRVKKASLRTVIMAQQLIFPRVYTTKDPMQKKTRSGTNFSYFAFLIADLAGGRIFK